MKKDAILIQDVQLGSVFEYLGTLYLKNSNRGYTKSLNLTTMVRDSFGMNTYCTVHFTKQETIAFFAKIKIKLNEE